MLTIQKESEEGAEMTEEKIYSRSNSNWHVCTLDSTNYLKIYFYACQTLILSRDDVKKLFENYDFSESFPTATKEDIEELKGYISEYLKNV